MKRAERHSRRGTVASARPTDPSQNSTKHRRRGVAAAFTMVCMVVLLGMAALAVDAGMLYSARTELQHAADAAALAAAWELFDERRLQGDSGTLAVLSDARQTAAEYALLHRVLQMHPQVDPDGDVAIGYLNELENPSAPISTTDMTRFNSVTVMVRRNEIRNGPVGLFFAQIFGIQSSNVGATATAAFSDAVEGYRVTPQTGNAELLPFAIHLNSWNGLVNGTFSTGDNYAYDPETGTVSAGSDGILELNMYPGAGATQLPSGNFGTVDIGSPSNSTSDLARQIVHGVNESDLSYFGGELRVPVTLNGDTGLSAGMKDELASIIGKPRAIPIFDFTSGGGGNTANYHVVQFAGIRIMAVKLTGSMNSKYVIIQPAFVVDDAAVTGPGDITSDYVFTKVRLVR